MIHCQRSKLTAISIIFLFFSQLKKENRLQDMPHIVFWYTAAKESEWYSLMQTNHVEEFDKVKGKALKTAKNRYERALKKMEAGTFEATATKTERKELAVSLARMFEDMKKEPAERVRGDTNFFEEWELPAEDGSFEGDYDESSLEPGAEKPAEKKPKKKRRKKGSKEGDDAPKKHCAKTGTAAEKEAPTASPAKDVGDIDEIGDAESEDDDDEEAEDFEKDEDDDKWDEDYYDESPERQQKKSKKGGEVAAKLSKRPRSSHKSAAEEQEKDRLRGHEPKVKFADGPKKKAQSDRKKEQSDFSQCEKSYLEDIEKWRSAIEREDLTRIDATLTMLQRSVEDFSAPFIEGYNLPQLMRQTKTLLKGKKTEGESTSLAVYKEVWDLMKKTHATKKEEVPAGFTPKFKRKWDFKPDSSRSRASSVSTVDSRHSEGEPKKPSSSQPTRLAASRSDELKKRDGVDVGSASMPAVPKSQSDSFKVPAKGDRRASAEPRLESDVPRSSTPRPSLQDLISRKTEPTSPVRRSLPDHVTELPGWVRGASMPSEPINVDGCNRMLALEFFRDMTSYFPVKKVNNIEEVPVINKESVARSLEGAVYTWATPVKGPINDDEQKEALSDRYWRKVHEVVAAITGKRGQPGVLMGLISDGKIESPEAVVKKTQRELLDSFEGLKM